MRTARAAASVSVSAGIRPSWSERAWVARPGPTSRADGLALGLAGTARFPEHQAARQPAQARARPSLDRAEQFLARGPAELAQVHVDRGERGPVGGRDDLPVVEADQRDVLGHPLARFAHG